MYVPILNVVSGILMTIALYVYLKNGGLILRSAISGVAFFATEALGVMGILQVKVVLSTILLLAGIGLVFYVAFLDDEFEWHEDYILLGVLIMLSPCGIIIM